MSFYSPNLIDWTRRGMLQCSCSPAWRKMNKPAKAVILFMAQGAYSGRFPVAPGTAGTLAGVLLYLGIKGLPTSVYASLCVLIFVIGIWLAGRAETLLG